MSLFKASLLALSLASLSLPSLAAAEANALEKGMAAALQFDPVKEDRGDTGKAIQAYMKAGVVNKKPDLRIDYDDYYFVNKPSTFLGHELFIIQEEYMTEYAGCCVDPGASLIMRLKGKDDALQAFAKKAVCKVETINMTEKLAYLERKESVPPGTYVELSCHFNDTRTD